MPVVYQGCWSQGPISAASLRNPTSLVSAWVFSEWLALPGGWDLQGFVGLPWAYQLRHLQPGQAGCFVDTGILSRCLTSFLIFFYFGLDSQVGQAFTGNLSLLFLTFPHICPQTGGFRSSLCGRDFFKSSFPSCSVANPPSFGSLCKNSDLKNLKKFPTLAWKSNFLRLIFIYKPDSDFKKPDLKLKAEQGLLCSGEGSHSHSL